MFIVAITITDISKHPQKVQKSPNNLPICVTGTTSPYPTVDIVIKTAHIQFP
jgi:hypothetical protein